MKLNLIGDSKNLANKRAVLVAGIVAGVSCGLLFGGRIASADGPQNGGSGAPSTRISRQAPQGLGNTPALTSSTNIAKVSAGPARPGVKQSHCDAKAASINATIGYQMEAQHDNQPEAALAYANMVDLLINDALDDGCFIIE
jgi:hypothetical protein